MKHFQLLKEEIDITTLLEEITINQECWQYNCERQEYFVAQRDTEVIHIREAVNREDIFSENIQETQWSELAYKFPILKKYLMVFAEQEQSFLSRAILARLKPKGKVYRHVDQGAYYVARNRYHLVLSSNNGSLLRSGNEEVMMQVGELWWIDNHDYHEAINQSNQWRIHLIFDTLPKKYANLIRVPLLPEEINF